MTGQDNNHQTNSTSIHSTNEVGGTHFNTNTNRHDEILTRIRNGELHMGPWQTSTIYPDNYQPPPDSHVPQTDVSSSE